MILYIKKHLRSELFIHNEDGFVVNGNCQMIRKSLL